MREIPEVQSIPEKKFKYLYLSSRLIFGLTAYYVMSTIWICNTYLWEMTRQNEYIETLLGVVIGLIVSIGMTMRTTWGKYLGVLYCMLLCLEVPVGSLIGFSSVFLILLNNSLFGKNRTTHYALKCESERRKLLAQG